ncbi:MAG TPA: FtsQ-type POTRA domain-containing protein, partial [Nitrospiria bacterium]|nr:FtsQ-type POTRA domain-containing protein [Nitrospiria bacterium]
VVLCSAIVLGLSAIVWAALRLVNMKEVHLFDGLFHVETVRVEGVSTDRAADVRAVIEKQPSVSLRELELEKIREALVQLRWVKEVLLRKEWPDALVVKITERAPLVWVEEQMPSEHRDRMPAKQGAGRYRLVDEDGVELESLDHPTAGFPVIRLNSISNIPDSGQAGLQAGIHVLKVLAASGMEAAVLADIEMEVRDAQEIRLRYQGLPLRLGSGDTEKQIRRFLLLKPELLAKASQISEVDLRFPGRLIVKSKAGFVGAYRRVAQIKGEAAPRPYTEGR